MKCSRPTSTAVNDRPEGWFTERDDIKRILADIFKEAAKQHWLDLLAASDIWCARVLDWDELTRSPAFAQLGMTQDATSRAGTPVRLMRTPVQINGVRGTSGKTAPAIGEHSNAIRHEFALSDGGSGH